MPLRPLDFPRPETLTEVADRAAKQMRKPHRSTAVLEQVDQWYLRISRRHVVSRSSLRERGLVDYGAKFHHRGLKYFADARTRVLAHLWERPDNVAASWSAAALCGVDDFSHSADSWVIGGGDVRPAPTALRPSRLRPRVEFEPWVYYERESPLHLTPPMLTMVQCLRSTLKQEHRWGVPKIPGLVDKEVRAVQVMDRFRRECGVGAADIRTACHSLLDQRLVGKLTTLSGPGVDSPPETSLRLILAPVVRELGGQLLPQVPVFRDGDIGESCQEVSRRNLLTIIDLADTVNRIAFYYDGEKHLERSRRDRDALITAELLQRGWLLLRVSAGMLAQAEKLRERVRRLRRPPAAKTAKSA